MTKNDVKILKEETMYSGFCKIVRYTLQSKLFACGWTKPYTREVLQRYKVAAALPYDSILDKVVLIEQFRIGAMQGNNSPWLFEVVAGIMDKEKDETHEELIHREMQEEAGLEVLDLIPIYDYFVSPGASYEDLKLFCAKVDSTKAPKFSGIADEHEDIRIHVLSTNDALELLHQNRINNATTLIALQWLELQQQKGSLPFCNN